MSTNFLQFNPGAANQETDAEYTGDGNRQNGFAPDAVVPSPLFNKILYQASTFVAAFAQAMGAVGVSAEDTTLATLAAAIQSVLSAPGVQELAFTATPSWNAASNSVFEMAVTNNVTSQTFTGLTPGQRITIIWKSSSTYAYTVAYPSNFNGFTQPMPNQTTVQSGIVDKEGNVWATSGAIAS